MNVLLVSAKTENSKGGIATWTDTYLNECDKHGIICSLLNIATVGRRAKQGNAKRSLKDEIIRTTKIFRELNKLLKSEKYDIVHLNSSGASFGMMRDYMIIKKISKAQPKSKIIVHFHCDVAFQIKGKQKYYYLKKIMMLVNSAIVLNQDSYKYLKDNFGFKSVILPNFIDDSYVRTTPKKINEDISKVMFVGYVQPQKGAKEIYQLADKFSDINFYMIGEVREDVKLWDKPENIVLCGAKERCEIIRNLDDADVFLFPTYSEGFSIALLESMARGVPCITTNVGANVDMIEDKGGVVTEVGDVEGLVKGIDYMKKSLTRERMSQWLVEKVKKEYTVTKVFEKIEKIYLSLM